MNLLLQDPWSCSLEQHAPGTRGSLNQNWQEQEPKVHGQLLHRAIHTPSRSCPRATFLMPHYVLEGPGVFVRGRELGFRGFCSGVSGTDTECALQLSIL